MNIISQFHRVTHYKIGTYFSGIIYLWMSRKRPSFAGSFVIKKMNSNEGLEVSLRTNL